MLVPQQTRIFCQYRPLINTVSLARVTGIYLCVTLKIKTYDHFDRDLSYGAMRRNET